MNKLAFYLPVLFFAGLSCLSVDAQSVAVSPSNQTQSTGTPIFLFDGQTTNGWSKANGETHEGWVVDNGALHRKSGGGDLYHESTFRDFELHFQWRISKGGNSGVKYRVKKYGKAMLGCEYQVLDDENAKERNKSACLYDVYEPVQHKPIVQHDVWQSSKIVVCGNRIEHWLNGVLVVQANVGGDQWKQRVADSKFRDRDGFGENREGRIFLQDHGNPVWFRQIILVPLNCDGQLASNPGPTIEQPNLEANLHSLGQFDGYSNNIVDNVTATSGMLPGQDYPVLSNGLPVGSNPGWSTIQSVPAEQFVACPPCCCRPVTKRRPGLFFRRR